MRKQRMAEMRKMKKKKKDPFGDPFNVEIMVKDQVTGEKCVIETKVEDEVPTRVQREMREKMEIEEKK